MELKKMPTKILLMLVPLVASSFVCWSCKEIKNFAQKTTLADGAVKYFWDKICCPPYIELLSAVGNRRLNKCGASEERAEEIRRWLPLRYSMVVKKSKAHGGDFWNGYFERFSVFDFGRESKVRSEKCIGVLLHWNFNPHCHVKV